MAKKAMDETAKKRVPAQELCGRALTQHIVEALSEVSVEVVQHQMCSACLGVCTGDPLCQASCRSPMIADDPHPNTCRPHGSVFRRPV